MMISQSVLLLVLAAVITPLLSVNPAFAQSSNLLKVVGVNCLEGQPCITDFVEETTQEEALQTDPMASGFAIFGHARNLILEIHKLDLWFVAYLAATMGVSIPPMLFMLISVSLLFLAIYILAKFAIRTTKHSVIIAIVVVAAIMLISFGVSVPVQT